jgi:uncharacterized protein
MYNKDLILVDIVGLSSSPHMNGNSFALLLKETEGTRKLPIIIGHYEAQAIAFEMEGIKPQRPLTHDLTRDIIENLGYKIERVIINELKDSTFFAKIKFDSDELDDIDARPSDAIALALKFSAPIYVASEIMDEVGLQASNNIYDSDESDSKTGLSGTDNEDYDDDSEMASDRNIMESKIEKLKHELEEAVVNEDYEKAAQIRDEIKKLEISNFN